MINLKTVLYFCSGDITHIENYERAINDLTQTYDCHHRRETDDGLLRKQLKELGLYYKRPACELIFLTHSEHMSLHQSGKTKSEETKRKNSEAHKGKPKSEEHKRKLSEAMKGIPKSEEWKQKHSESMKGKHRVYNEDGTYHYEK